MCLGLAGFTAGFATDAQAEAVSLTYEYASSVNGPWTVLDPTKVQVSPTGSVNVETVAGTNVFFRLRVISTGGETTVPVVTLAQIPTRTVDAAKSQLVRMAEGPDSEFGDLAEVELSPFAPPILDAF